MTGEMKTGSYRTISKNKKKVKFFKILLDSDDSLVIIEIEHTDGVGWMNKTTKKRLTQKMWEKLVFWQGTFGSATATTRLGL